MTRLIKSITFEGGVLIKKISQFDADLTFLESFLNLITTMDFFKIFQICFKSSKMTKNSKQNKNNFFFYNNKQQSNNTYKHKCNIRHSRSGKLKILSSLTLFSLSLSLTKLDFRPIFTQIFFFFFNF